MSKSETTACLDYQARRRAAVEAILRTRPFDAPALAMEIVAALDELLRTEIDALWGENTW